MNNFIFHYPTKVYFGKGCVKEYLRCLLEKQGPTVMLAYGGGSVKKNGIYDQMMDILAQAGKTVVEFGGIANWRTMEHRQNALAALGIETEFHHYPGLGHGFGLGTGTVAQGWLDEAAAFWQRQIDKVS